MCTIEHPHMQKKTHSVYMRFFAYVDIRINRLQYEFSSVCQLKRICTHGKKSALPALVHRAWMTALD